MPTLNGPLDQDRRTVPTRWNGVGRPRGRWVLAMVRLFHRHRTGLYRAERIVYLTVGAIGAVLLGATGASWVRAWLWGG